MLFIHLFKTDFFCFFNFFNIIMYVLNITSALKKMTVNELRDFVLENHYKRIGFSEENCYCSMKHQQK